mmetsp:Transcript_29578/g.51938  ORF Transcript_29578/g.51938 Transcript_29578/m.51938 type:complete len:130 (+) Transcript_29578:225-614(+)
MDRWTFVTLQKIVAFAQAVVFRPDSGIASIGVVYLACATSYCGTRQDTISTLAILAALLVQTSAPIQSEEHSAIAKNMTQSKKNGKLPGLQNLIAGEKPKKRASTEASRKDLHIIRTAAQYAEPALSAE